MEVNNYVKLVDALDALDRLSKAATVNSKQKAYWKAKQVLRDLAKWGAFEELEPPEFDVSENDD